MPAKCGWFLPSLKVENSVSDGFYAKVETPDRDNHDMRSSVTCQRPVDLCNELVGLQEGASFTERRCAVDLKCFNRDLHVTFAPFSERCTRYPIN